MSTPQLARVHTPACTCPHPSLHMSTPQLLHVSLPQDGVVVDVKDLDDDPQDANALLWVAMDGVTVIVHTAFIWLLALPMLVACVQFQQLYYDTTAVENLLTLEMFRLEPMLITSLYIDPFLVVSV
eukprot:365095-Chlamydomonas_euryale.AAC.13